MTTNYAAPAALIEAFDLALVPTVYLAGDDLLALGDAAAILRAQGIGVVAVHEVASRPLRERLAWQSEALVGADAVVSVDGWASTLSARHVVGIASALGKPVVEFTA